MDTPQQLPERIGRYEMRAELGRGSMARVYRCFDPRSKRDVAVKVLLPELCRTPSFRSRFERQVETVVALEHSAIVPVYDVSEEDGVFYLVMRWMAGGSLAERLQHSPLSLSEAARILRRIAAALDCAHRAGILHGNIKPANILFDTENEPYLSDFGLARLADECQEALPAANRVSAPAYMSPEQARGEKTDGRSDIYSLGAMLFQMLTGRLPYESDSPISILAEHLTEPVPRILEANPYLPPACETLIQRAMAEKREARFATAGEMAAALTDIAQGSSPAILVESIELANAEAVVKKLVDESLSLEQSGDMGAALNRAQRALEQAQASGAGEMTAAALTQLAFIEFRLGNGKRAQELAQQALTLAAPDSPVRCRAWTMLGHCACESDSLDEAETYYRQVADLARRIGHHVHRAHALHNLANGVYFPRGLFDLALTMEEECAQVIRQHKLGNQLRFPLLTIAWISQVTGQRQRARAALAELGNILAPDSAFWGYHAFLSGELALDEGEIAIAQELLHRALAIAEKIGEPGLNGVTRLAMSRCLRLCSNAPAAHTWADDVAKLAQRAGYQHLQGLALIERAWAAWLCGNAEKAIADLRQAQGTLTPLGAAFDLARAAFLLAAILHAQGDPAASTAWLDAVQQITRGGYAFLLERERTLAFPLLAAYLNEGDEATQTASAKLLADLARVPPQPLRIVTLGRFEVRQGGRTVPEAAWRHRRAGELFRLLLVSRGQALSREQAVELLWPDKSPEMATTSFHQATSSLRRVLEPDLPDKFPSRYLEVDSGRVALHLPPGSWLDLEAFEQHIRQGEWAAAVGIYGGELFPDDRYADWAAAPRECLAQQFIAALLALAGAALDAGQPQEALAAACRVLEIDPWQESAVLLAMQAHLALNNRAAALRIYHNLEQTLRQELGITPGEKLQAFYRSINRT